MKPSSPARCSTLSPRGSIALCMLSVSLAALLVAGCSPRERGGERVMGWTLVDPSQRHPILVSKQPHTLSLRIARDAYGLSPHQRAQLIDFLERYRAGDAGDSRLVIAAPSGSANEVASMQAVSEIRHLMRQAGFAESSIVVEAYHEERNANAAVRISYLRFVAEAPRCGHWPTNVADQRDNLPYPNLGCATQRNFAAQVANPADLLGPRTVTDGSSERRDVVWQKYVKGESTIARKQSEERVQVKGAE